MIIETRTIISVILADFDVTWALSVEQCIEVRIRFPFVASTPELSHFCAVEEQENFGEEQSFRNSLNTSSDEETYRKVNSKILQQLWNPSLQRF